LVERALLSPSFPPSLRSPPSVFHPPRTDERTRTPTPASSATHPSNELDPKSRKESKRSNELDEGGGEVPLTEGKVGDGCQSVVRKVKTIVSTLEGSQVLDLSDGETCIRRERGGKEEGSKKGQLDELSPFSFLLATRIQAEGEEGDVPLNSSSLSLRGLICEEARDTS